MQLTFHLFVLYGFLGMSMLLLCSYSLFVMHDYEETIADVDREQLPLARTIAEISRHQLDKTLRFSEILLFARINDQEKFEIGNESFIQAGKRMGVELFEGINIAQKGVDLADSPSRSKEFEKIKLLLDDIKTARGKYDELGASLIRSIYQYDFMSKKEYLLSGDHVAAEEESSKHVAFLKITIATLEAVTLDLEINIKEAMERAKQLSQTLAIYARKQEEQAFGRLLPILFAVLSGGLLLVLVIAKMYKNQERAKNQLAGQSLAILSAALSQLQRAFQILEPTSLQLENTFFLQRDSFGSTIANLKEIVHFSEYNLLIAEQLQSLTSEKKVTMEKVGILVKQLSNDAGNMLESGIESKRIVRNLREAIIQINLLATNANAEASRSEATRSFTVFTKEIKDLSKSSVAVSETISNRTDEAIKGIHADRLHVIQTHQGFSELVELVKKEVDLFEMTTTAIQQQFALLQTVQDAATGVQVALQASAPLLEQMKVTRNILQSQTEVAHEAVGGWPV